MDLMMIEIDDECEETPRNAFVGIFRTFREILTNAKRVFYVKVFNKLPIYSSIQYICINIT